MILCLRSLTTIACTQYQWGLGGLPLQLLGRPVIENKKLATRKSGPLLPGPPLRNRPTAATR